MTILHLYEETVDHLDPNRNLEQLDLVLFTVSVTDALKTQNVSMVLMKTPVPHQDLHNTGSVLQ